MTTSKTAAVRARWGSLRSVVEVCDLLDEAEALLASQVVCQACDENGMLNNPIDDDRSAMVPCPYCDKTRVFGDEATLALLAKIRSTP